MQRSRIGKRLRDFRSQKDSTMIEIRKTAEHFAIKISFKISRCLQKVKMILRGIIRLLKA